VSMPDNLVDRSVKIKSWQKYYSIYLKVNNSLP